MNNICIVGGGSIGSILAYYLYRAGVNDIIVYYGSLESVKAIESENGVFVRYNNVDHLIPVKPKYFKEQDVYCKFVINSVKAYSVEETIDLMKNITDNKSLILMIQNGFGSLELVEEKLSDRIVCCGVVFIGAERISRNRVVHNGGNTIISGCRKIKQCIELINLSELFKKGGCDFRVVDDIDLYRWIKLSLNAVVNPLTAITLSKNKIVLSEKGLILAKLILEEVVEASSRFGYKLELDRLLKLIVRNVENVAENYSSMVQDLLNVGKTEIDYINGYVAKIIGSKSINMFITELVHLIEESMREKLRADNHGLH
ncbi:MAG: 2-dehydropantoate 2-reductase [Desulfurococcaceae archaeon]